MHVFMFGTVLQQNGLKYVSEINKLVKMRMIDKCNNDLYLDKLYSFWHKSKPVEKTDYLKHKIQT